MRTFLKVTSYEIMENYVQGHTNLHVVLVLVAEVAYVLSRIFSPLFSDFSDMVMYVQNESGLSIKRNEDNKVRWLDLLSKVV